MELNTGSLPPPPSDPLPPPSRSKYGDTAALPALLPDHRIENAKPEPTTQVSQTFRAFAFRDYRILWAGALTSSTGSWMQVVAQGWLVLTLTGSPFWLGVDAFLTLLPGLLLSPLGGVVADRIDRRYLLMASQIVQMTFAVTIAALLFFKVIAVWHILVLSFLTGTAMAFGSPAYLSLLPSLVPRDVIPNAVAFNSIQFNLARAIGPACAGVALLKFGAETCFLLNGFSFAAVILSLLVISPYQPPKAKQPSTVIRDLRLAWKFVIRNRVLWQLCAVCFSSTFLANCVPTLMPAFARNVLHGDAQLYSQLVACSGVGAVLAGILVAALSERPHRGMIVACAQIVLGTAGVLFAGSETVWLSTILAFFTGFGWVMVFSLSAGLVQAKVPDEFRGRVVSMYLVCFQGGMALGSLIAGKLATQFSPQSTVTVEGSLMVLIGLSLILSRSEISRL